MVSVVNLTNNQDIDGILWGWKIDRTNITYSFPTGTAEYSSYAQVNGFSSFNATQQDAVRSILGNVASFCNLTFTETTASGALFRYAEATSIQYTTDSNVAQFTDLHNIDTAEATPPELAHNGAAPFAPAFAQGDSWYNTTGYDNPLKGSFQYAAGIMHETGHNLGLKHGHATQGGHGLTFPTLPASHDSYEFSVMTYREFPGANPDDGDTATDHPTTFMMNDIQALQHLYGANYNYNSGDTTYRWNPETGEYSINGVGTGAPNRNFILMTVWDGGGNDTYDFSNYTTNLDVDLAPGGWTTVDQNQLANLGSGGLGGANYIARGNIANALQDVNNPAETLSLIENAWGGSGNDRMTGNQVNNVLKGGGGADNLQGYEGSDKLYGGSGDDILKGGGGADELFGEDGVDTVEYLDSSFGVTINLATNSGLGGTAEGDTFSGIENIDGSAHGDSLTGNGDANVLRGGDGNDTLKGGGGADVLNGGAGNDTVGYFDATAGVSVSLGSNSGSGSDAAGDALVEVENLFGSAFKDQLTGNDGNNILDGWDGDDLLKGGGGADELNGGNGVDTIDYVISGTGVYVDLASGVGADGDAAGDTYSSIENVNGSGYVDTLFGGSANNLLYGNGGNDTIYGEDGADNLYGGSGADLLYGGNDANIDFARYDDQDHGNLTIRLDASNLNTGSAAGDTYDGIEGLVGGIGNDTISGNGAANQLFGLNGNDLIYGQGGADYLNGGGGTNQLWGGNDADSHIGGAGLDYARYDDANWGNLTIRLDASNLNTGVAAGDTYSGIEGIVAGIGNDTIVGNGLANQLFGGIGNDLIYGQAGADYLNGGNGTNQLWGGAGADSHAGGTGVDYARYDDANWGNLTIRLDASSLNTGAAAGDTYSGVDGIIGGLGVDTIVGNAANNLLFGGGANDLIYGLGGNDYLNGGAGSDQFVFLAALNATTNVDTVSDFAHGVDDFNLAKSIFASIGAALDASELRLGAAAADANDYLIYNSANGQLFYDVNGSGAGGQTLFATVTAGTVLDVGDFVMV
ncbi:MAG: M10 family metallopeptidase C-terminal domain-containing protein [Rhizobiaceae bacterium]